MAHTGPVALASSMSQADSTARAEPPNTFAGGLLDRAAHLRSAESAVRRMLHAPDTRFLPFRELAPLLVGDDRLAPAWQARARVDDLLAAGATPVFLGLERGARFVLGVPPSARRTELGHPAARFIEVRAAAPRLSAADASIVALGRSLLAWHRDHGYCPRCGAASEAVDAGHRRRCTGVCGLSQFPRTDPVVIMLIHREGRVLLGRSVRARPYPPGLYSCLAGYLEPGESIEEAVRRETLEEAGLPIGDVRYHSSQPWPFPSTLMIGCFAEALTEAIRRDPAELEDARWFTPAELHAAVRGWSEEGTTRLPPPFTIAHRLAEAWLAGRTHPGHEDLWNATA